MNRAWYRTAVTQVIFPVIDAFVGTKLYSMSRHAKRGEFAAQEELRKEQNSRLQHLLIHAYTNVPYYTDLFDRIKLKKLETATIETLKEIPSLTKDLIRDNYDRLISGDVTTRKFKIHSTGGSTGNPLKFMLDLNSWSATWANIFRGWGYADYVIGDKVLMLGSSSIFKEYKKSKEQVFLHSLLNFTAFPGMNMSDDVCEALADTIVRNRVRYLYGYSSSIYLFAKYMLKQGKRIHLKGVFPTSEMCPDHYKAEYKKAFHCAVVDCYGARDGGISAFQCSEGMFHISENSVVWNNELNSAGEVFITDLYNYCMPFINYSVGDFLTLTDEPCRCGRGAPCATQIVGRKEEIMQFKNGRNITGPGWTILFKDRSVEKYRLLKLSDDNLEVQIVPGKQYRKEIEEDIIISSIKKHVGEEITVSIQYCKEFQPLPNGKAGYFIS